MSYKTRCSTSFSKITESEWLSALFVVKTISFSYIMHFSVFVDDVASDVQF